MVSTSNKYWFTLLTFSFIDFAVTHHLFALTRLALSDKKFGRVQIHSESSDEVFFVTFKRNLALIKYDILVFSLLWIAINSYLVAISYERYKSHKKELEKEKEDPSSYTKLLDEYDDKPNLETL